MNQAITTANTPFAVSLDGSATDFNITVNATAPGTNVEVSPLNGTLFVGDSNYPFALSEGLPILSGSPTTTATKLTGYGPEGLKGNWSNGGAPAYLGVEFQISGETHFGWAEISASVGELGGASAELISYAYNDVAYDGTNLYESSIAAGDLTTATPEPSSRALYAIGAAGILALRRRRRAAA